MQVVKEVRSRRRTLGINTNKPRTQNHAGKVGISGAHAREKKKEGEGETGDSAQTDKNFTHIRQTLRNEFFIT